MSCLEGARQKRSPAVAFLFCTYSPHKIPLLQFSTHEYGAMRASFQICFVWRWGSSSLFNILTKALPLSVDELLALLPWHILFRLYCKRINVGVRDIMSIVATVSPPAISSQANLYIRHWGKSWLCIRSASLLGDSLRPTTSHVRISVVFPKIAKH